MLQSTGLQRVGHDLVTEQHQQLKKLAMPLWATGLNGTLSPLRVGVGAPITNCHSPGGLWITETYFPQSWRLEVSDEGRAA